MSLAALAVAGCLAKGASVSGELRFVETRHVGNHQLLRYPFVVLTEPVRLCGAKAAGRWVQLALRKPAGAKALRPGDTITVRANYGEPMSAWHIGDIVAFDAVVTATSPP